MTTGSEIVTDFVSALRQIPGLSVKHSGISRNVWGVGADSTCLLYIKGRSEKRYKWGVTANVVARLKSQNQRWLVLLLYEKKDTGYLLTATDVLHYIDHVWPLGQDGDYKPAEGNYLSRNKPFVSLKNCVSNILIDQSTMRRQV